jgi:hypothetical protein
MLLYSDRKKKQVGEGYEPNVSKITRKPVIWKYG